MPLTSILTRLGEVFNNHSIKYFHNNNNNDNMCNKYIHDNSLLNFIISCQKFHFNITLDNNGNVE